MCRLVRTEGIVLNSKLPDCVEENRLNISRKQVGDELDSAFHVSDRQAVVRRVPRVPQSPSNV